MTERALQRLVHLLRNIVLILAVCFSAELNAREALLRTLADTAGDLDRPKFDPGLSRFAENFAREMAEEAVGPGGAVDLTKFTTRDELNTLLDRRRRFLPDAELDIDVHHLARNDLAKILKPGLTDAQHHQMPAIILRKKAHQMTSNRNGAEFERLLHNKLPVRPPGAPAYRRDIVLQQLQEAYMEFGLPEMMPIIRAWADAPLE